MIIIWWPDIIVVTLSLQCVKLCRKLFLASFMTVLSSVQFFDKPVNCEVALSIEYRNRFYIDTNLNLHSSLYCKKSNINARIESLFGLWEESKTNTYIYTLDFYGVQREKRLSGKFNNIQL